MPEIDEVNCLSQTGLRLAVAMSLSASSIISLANALSISAHSSSLTCSDERRRSPMTERATAIRCEILVSSVSKTAFKQSASHG